MNVLLDTCFWIALFDRRDQRHEAAVRLWEEKISPHSLLIPWPTMYEFINTRLIGQPGMLLRFQKVIRLPTTVQVDDLPYRADAITATLTEVHMRNRYSLVDRVLRAMIEDRAVPIHAFVSSNLDDFHDVCAKRGVETVDIV